MQDIASGSFIVEYMGEILDQKKYSKRKKEYAGEQHTHLMLEERVASQLRGLVSSIEV